MLSTLRIYEYYNSRNMISFKLSFMQYMTCDTLSITTTTPCLKKRATFIFWIYSKKHWPILIIFGMQHCEEIWYKPPLYLNTVTTLPCEMRKTDLETETSRLISHSRLLMLLLLLFEWQQDIVIVIIIFVIFIALRFLRL